MPWQFHYSGLITKDGISVGRGYSGKGEGKNNPAMQNVRDLGPIPAGLWIIAGPPYDTKEHGPYVLRLEPDPRTETYGRVGFLIHGDSLEHPGEASCGCLITDRDTRRRMFQSGDSKLYVVSL